MSLVRIGIVLALAIAGIAVWSSRSDSGSRSADAPTSAATSRQSPTTTSSPDTNAVPVAETLPTAPLAAGEHWIDLGLPGGVYQPKADNGGTDDYRCMILDPKLSRDAFLTGVVLEPGNGQLVHHAILYRVDPGQAAAAKALDAEDPRVGWSCFGGPGLPSGRGIEMLDSAPWVAAFATKGGEQLFAPGTGQLLAKGSVLVLQIHYNLLNGDGPDYSKVRLRVAPASARLKQLQTMLLPAPVELACPSGVTGKLCDRTQSLLDVMSRFGAQAAYMVSGLHFLCGGNPSDPPPSLTESCTRPVTKPMQIVGVAGHMHMLGRTVTLDLLHANGSQQRLLDVKVWNFDDQRGTRLASPVTVGPGDSLKVTCSWDPTLRQKLPALKKLPPRYIVWGEGSSDEMCLGLVSYVTP